MGGINISYNIVREKANKMEEQIQSILDGDIMTGYQGIEEAVGRSCGTAAEAAMEDIRQEREALAELRGVLMKMLELLCDSVDAFEEADRDYSVFLEEKED